MKKAADFLLEIGGFFLSQNHAVMANLYIQKNYFSKAYLLATSSQLITLKKASI